MDVMALVLELMISAVGRPSLPEPQLQTIETDTSWERTLLLGLWGTNCSPAPCRGPICLGPEPRESRRLLGNQKSRVIGAKSTRGGEEHEAGG